MNTIHSSSPAIVRSRNYLLSAAGCIFAAAMLGYTWAPCLFAQSGATISNPAGVSLSIESNTNDAAYAEQTNAAGITLQLTAAFDASTDTTNPAGVTAYVGQIDPEPIAGTQQNSAGVTWTLYDSPPKL